MSLYLSMKKILMVAVLFLAIGNINGFSATTDHTENPKSEIELSIDNDFTQSVDLIEVVSVKSYQFVVDQNSTNSNDFQVSKELMKHSVVVDEVKNYNKIERSRYKTICNNFKNTKHFTASEYIHNIENPPSNLS